MSWIYLSHILNEATPFYGGKGRVQIARTHLMAAGDSSNNSDLVLPSHAGTHVDAPCHFDQTGVTLDTYQPEYWQAVRPWLLDVHCQPGDILDLVRIGADLETVPMDCDLLLLRTGAEQWREDSPEIYAEQGPGVADDVARWLRSNRRLKFLGMDFISASSFLHREIGRRAHAAFLSSNEAGDMPILLVEDMSLIKLERAPQSVWIVPLRYIEADGAPVTVLAQV